jgi:hypothetical protein
MNHKIEINSLVVNKLKNSQDNFIKYDIDISLDETESTESGIKLKYKIALLSDPTNTKLTAEGFVSLFGNETELSKKLEPDKNNIPLIVNVIYQEIYPLIYIICKSMEIPMPAYKLTQITSAVPRSTTEDPTKEEPIEQTTQKINPVEEIVTEQNEISSETEAEAVIQEAKVSSI